jgi:hypothetical protein
MMILLDAEPGEDITMHEGPTFGAGDNYKWLCLDPFCEITYHDDQVRVAPEALKKAREDLAPI